MYECLYTCVNICILLVSRCVYVFFVFVYVYIYIFACINIWKPT